MLEIREENIMLIVASISIWRIGICQSVQWQIIQRFDWNAFHLRQKNLALVCFRKIGNIIPAFLTGKLFLKNIEKAINYDNISALFQLFDKSFINYLLETYLSSSLEEDHARCHLLRLKFGKNVWGRGTCWHKKLIQAILHWGNFISVHFLSCI